MANIRKGDLVQVISGPTQERGGDRGKQGKVIEVLRESDRVIVEGINYVTKHVKVGQTQRGTKTGGIETVEAPVHISKVALVDPKTNQPARVGYEIVNGKKERVFKPSRRVAKPTKAAAKKTTKKADAAEAAEATTADTTSEN
jgi:large subunit ribosomal protein L24